MEEGIERERENVQVDDVSLVHVLESEHQLSEDSLRLGDRQHSIDRSDHVVMEIASSSELHGEEQSIVDLDSIMELDDVRVREGSHEIGLSESELSVGVGGIELLDDDGLSSDLADGHVDGAVVSAVELLSELVSVSAELASDAARSLRYSRRSRRTRRELLSSGGDHGVGAALAAARGKEEQEERERRQRKDQCMGAPLLYLRREGARYPAVRQKGKGIGPLVPKGGLRVRCCVARLPFADGAPM